MRSNRSMQFIRTILLAPCMWAFLSAGAVEWMPSARAAEDAALHQRANETLGLLASDLVTLEFDRTPGVSQEILVPFDGALRVLEVYPHSVRSDLYQLKVQVADGSLVNEEPGPVRTIRGTVQGYAAGVAGSVTEKGLYAMILLPDGREYWVEPLLGRVEGATAAHHVVYRATDAVCSGGSCATEADRSREMLDGEEPPPEGPTSGCDGLPCLTELGCDADFEYFTILGGVGPVENRINLITNTVNLQYEIEVGVVHVITAIIVRTAEPDPYDTNDCGELLTQFRAEWLANHQDIPADEHELFTGKSLVGCAGVAWGIGVICGSSSYCLTDHEPAFSCATHVSAHELGHLWGASHCTCSGFTMNPSFPPCVRNFHPTFTIPSIVTHREFRQCLDSAAPPISMPFEEHFDGPEVDPASWYNAGGTIDDQGNGEPSGDTSLRLNGQDMVTSGHFDAVSVGSVGLEYYWQRTGLTGGSPELNEDLLVEYKKLDGRWGEADRQLGDGADDLPYARACVLLPADAELERGQFRFRILNAEPNDNFFVDDVRVTDGAEFLVITEQPEFGCACLDGTGEFHVVAEGEGPFSYQWYLNSCVGGTTPGAPCAIDDDCPDQGECVGVAVPGATGDSLVISPVQEDDFGSYSAIVTNACGTIESDRVLLLEATPLAISVQPQDVTLPIGGTLAFFVIVTGQCPDFQWYHNGVLIPDATSPFLVIPDVQCEDQGCYHFVMSNDCGTVTSDTAEVTIETCPPFNCDEAPPVVVHGAGLPGETRPFSGYIDPRSESSDGATFDRGISTVEFLFSEPVDHIDGGALAPDSFIVTETGGGAPPNVTSVDSTNMPLVTITLDRPITLKEWTTIQAVVQDQGNPPNVIADAGNQGPGVDESDRVDIAFLPADVDQSGDVSPFDLLRFRQIVNNLVVPEQGTIEDFVDMDRDGSVSPFDLLLFRQLINGIAPATQEWAGEELNNQRP